MELAIGERPINARNEIVDRARKYRSDNGSYPGTIEIKCFAGLFPQDHEPVREFLANNLITSKVRFS